MEPEGSSHNSPALVPILTIQQTASRDQDTERNLSKISLEHCFLITAKTFPASLHTI
jgi:hypothetical protein